MAITTLARAKAILKKTDSTDDVAIDMLIPLVEADYLRIRNKPWDIGNALSIAPAAVVAVAGDITITLDDADYPVALEIGDTAESIAYKIKAALESASYYTVQAIGATVYLKNHTRATALTLAFTDTDGTGVTATVSGPGIIYPEGAELTAIKMIQYQLTAGLAAGLSSERLGDYSVSYEAGGGDGRILDYPKSVVGSIRRHARSM